MLEGLAAWVLNNYLGKYVENLNTDQLSIALLSGKVELENLPLRKDALRHLGLPVEIKAGFIGKVKLQIPVRQIRSAPWVIVFEQLYLVASPLPVHQWDAETEEIARHELKLSALDQIEAQWRLETDSKHSNSQTYYSSTYSSWLNFGTGVISDIIENIQLKIQDVHIRYEDNLSIKDKNVVFGVTIDSLSAESCDANWSPGFCHLDKGGESYKLLEMQKFGIYLEDVEAEKMMSDLSLGDLAVLMSPQSTMKNVKHFLVPPVSAHAHVKSNHSEQPLRSGDTPRFACDLVLDDVPITLADWQYDQIVKCVKGLDNVSRYRGYRRYKPPFPLKDDPIAWWIYAINCMYPGRPPAVCKPKPTWETCLTMARQNVQYVKIYSKILVTPTIALSSEEKKLKDEVEIEREYEELKVLREVAMRSVTLPSVKNNQSSNSAGRSMLENWFPGWMGWYSSGTNENASENTSPEAKQLEGEILQVLADSVENNTIFRRDAVFGKFNFILKRGCVNLCTSMEDYESSPMLELEFKNLSMNIVSKPRTQAHLVELSLGALYLKDKIVRDSLFSTLVGPPGYERTCVGRCRGPQSPRVSVVSQMDICPNDTLFYLAYEKKPQNSLCDYRLRIQSKCLDIVYQPNAIKWLVEFVCLPHQKMITQSRIAAMKSRTKKELMKNWDQILGGRMINRTTWDLQFDISAPQIIFVENFFDQNSSVAVIDFGRLQLKNNLENATTLDDNTISKGSEDEETFVTPCSTPPQSEASDSEDQTLDISSAMEPLPPEFLTETSIHQKLYDRYSVEMTDLQILIGRVKDNWRYAHNKGSSTLHVLDRFNISVQIERRIIHTVDPLYPSLTFNANLPKLVAHLNESKINAARNLLHIITTTGLPSPFKNVETADDSDFDVANQDDEPSLSVDTSLELSRLLMVQFIVDHMSLEVQSRGRSVAELQVSGVKVTLMKRSIDMSITLTVHSLLLVDALQTFGADFELLVASHKHVGMDSMSGSLRDSEPTSPISPASPDPNVSRPITTSAVALSQALHSLTSSPPYIHPMLRTTTVLDAEALITVEVILITGQEPMQIANVQFNNLDIIANQETIVELMGFTRRVFPKSQKIAPTTIAPSSIRASTDSLQSLLEPKIGRTELTFDFHRLNVLLLRGVVKDGVLQGKKICTATMSEAKIQATVSNKVEIEGSLGGLQVLDLTPEGHMHQRIVSVGKDPLLIDVIHPLYALPMHDIANETTAFSFKVIRNLESQGDKDVADITVRMASLWYTHSPHFVCELQSCATEFKQYMANLARSIRSAATDMALGLVQARAEALAQSLYMNARLSSSIYGSAFSLSECSSPRKRRRSGSVGASGYSSARDTLPQTPYSPDDVDDIVIDIKLDIILDSPVVVLPRASNSSEVFIAHLGRIIVSNREARENTNGYHEDYTESRTEFYEIEIRDMNLFSLDTLSRRTKDLKKDAPMIKPEVLYNCDTLAKPILHDTLLKLNIEREICKGVPINNSSESILPLDDDALSCESTKSNIQIYGAVVTALKVSLTRMQYEQLLDTLQWLTTTPRIAESQTILRSIKPQSVLGDISEEDTGVTTLNMDPHVRAKLFPTMTTVQKTNKGITSKMAKIKVSFELPIFTIELRGNIPSTEQGLIDVSFQEFVFSYEKSHNFETNIQVSLRSIFMEDLLQPEGSKQRAMVISSSGGELPPNASCLSRSCPNVTYNAYFSNPLHNSLPDHLETSTIFGMANCKTQNVQFSQRHDNLYPCTPPPSPTQGKRNKIERNLVLISILLVDKDAPNFNSQYNSLNMSTSVDFNCLDLVISVESWVVLIDFFGATPSNVNSSDQISQVTNIVQDSPNENIETNITVRSLTMVLVKSGVDIARANISKVEIAVKSCGLKKEVEGNLGSMSLLDLTLHGQLYKERFLTSGSQALKFKYVRHSGSETKNYDAHLEIGMSSVVYVHTKRFVAELQAFFNHFTQLQRVMEGIRAATSGQKVRNEPLKLALSIYAGSPIILVPVSSKCSDLLVVNLGQLLVKNRFKMSNESKHASHVRKTDNPTLLDVMSVELQNMDLYMGIKENDLRSSNYSITDSFQLGSIRVTRNGPSLLTKKFQVKFIVERNLLNYLPNYRIVPDMSIYGQLSTLDATLDLKQYRLLKGLFMFNLGEDTERILPSVSSPITSSFPSASDAWTLSSIKLDLQNVTLRLRENSMSPPLTCINFIKSRLTVETFSNLSQDVDLVSQEILIMDTRFDHSPGAEPPNVFTNILQPVKSTNQDVELVQVEVHSRKRRDHTKFTVLLNNMRLMAVFDWWEALQKFIFQNVDNVAVAETPEHQKLTHSGQNRKSEQGTFEVKLNITDSEIVVVENTAQWDTHAVILKSTTVITYKPKNLQKPLSCNLNHCEMFSCILGMEEETALSIIDPITLNIDINGDNKLEAQLQYLTVRLSYHDMKMFLQILNSLPKQMLSGQVDKQRKIYSKEQVSKLSALGFSFEDCIVALEKSGNKLDEAAIWLTKYAVPRAETVERDDLKLSIHSVEVKANSVSICIIDDCGDADVPLLEFSLRDVWLRQNLQEKDANSLYRKGSLGCILASDYYNRVLSGWEPFLEPWNCMITWHKSLSAALLKNRLNVEIRSQDILNVNITSTLLDLYKQVKENWTKDYYCNTNDKNGGECSNDLKTICQSPTYKQRSPFVPFALKNDTGSILHFSTVISEVDDVEATQSRQPDDSVITVLPGETVPFSFRVRDKMRHQDSHKRKMHQLIVKVDGWQQALPPVSVDKVGVYFRHSVVEIKSRSNMQADIPPARIIFDIALEGSARKLVTIRSAVLVRNKLSENVEIKLESQYLGSGWVPSKALTIESGKTLAIPLQYAHSDIDVRPFGSSKKYVFCTPSISWKQPNSELLYDVMTCSSQKSGSYRFCSNITKEKYVIEGNHKSDQPAHRITLLPTVKIVNLLPIDLIYAIKGENGRVTAGSSNALTCVDPDEVIEVNVLVENFVSSTSVIIPAGCVTDFSCRIRLEDISNRKLYLQAVISCNREAKIKIVISAPYWIINRTGLPLVFRQAGTSTLGAGQSEEHEFARMLLPLLFSFSDHDASPTINARVGNHVIRDGNPQWCSNFHVQKGIQVRKLRVTMTDGRPDTVFVVGIEIRPGRGRYRSTNIITISPRYQVHNRSSYQLVFCQSFFTLTLSDPNQQKTSLRLMPNSHMPFHWPRLDQDQYLCVSIKDIPDCCWSGGLKIDANSSLHVNIRDINGRVYFLRLEIVLQGATFFIVFTDADAMPPPMRVDNFSEVSLTFAQSSSKEVHHSTARAHSSIPYAWDQPTQPPLLTVVAPGGICKTYDMSKLGPCAGLTYENFIYIAFIGTFTGDTLDPLDVENQELVLDVVNETQVVLARKRQGQRSQLWRMTSTGHVQHEGSSPPYHPNQPRSDHVLVLDIEGNAPQPNSYSRLMLRRMDPRRISTQLWKFTDDGLLCCAHYNMCVQAQDGFYGLRKGNVVVLGMPQKHSRKLTDKGVPIEQAVGRQRLRPGSGFLGVEITMDGPTRVLVIKDLKEKNLYATSDDREWGSIAVQQRPHLDFQQEDDDIDKSELQFTVHLQGLGVSVVCCKTPEELLYGLFSNIVGETVVTPDSKTFSVSVGNVQIDNQLFETTTPVVLYVTPPNIRNNDEGEQDLPAILFQAEMQKKVNENAVIFKYLILRLKNISVILEELLLLKFCSFAGLHSQEEELFNKRDENDFETQRLLTKVSTAHSKRYYFGVLQLVPNEIRLSVKTASKLGSHLQKIKRKLGLTLIKFEDAAIDLQAFDRKHPFETWQFLLDSIIKHFKDELMWQAGIILGSVDFLGNPLGFVNDVSEGLSGFFLEGNVSALVKNVTHGISNSAAKVTESLSDGLGKVAMDDRHEETRQRYKRVETGRGRDHIVAGFKGLGFGLLGGATSIFKQVYEGLANDGIQGAFSGMGKGLVGAVTKPVVGVLDLASETARAVRDSSRSKIIFERHRLPRCVHGYGGLLPRYNSKQSQGQQYLYMVNDKNYNEQLIAFEVLGSASEDLQCIVSNERVRIVANNQDLTPIIDCHLINLISCKVFEEKEHSDSRYYIEIVQHVAGTTSAILVNPDPVKKPRVRCRSLELARTVAQQINYAKRLYTEYLYTLHTDNIAVED